MKIEDLSIGDWVCYTGKCIDGIGPNRKITYIERDACGFLIGLDYGGFHYSSAKIEDIVPIPITPEILEKNGVALAEDYDENGGLFACPAFSVVKYGNSYTFEVPQARVRVEHVHELQHAIRLAGIEKEIEV